jgi:hypothetical protein
MGKLPHYISLNVFLMTHWHKVNSPNKMGSVSKGQERKIHFSEGSMDRTRINTARTDEAQVGIGLVLLDLV